MDNQSQQDQNPGTVSERQQSYMKQAELSEQQEKLFNTVNEEEST